MQAIERSFFQNKCIATIYISMSSAGGGDSARSKVALITGITGQDGSYLAELLLQKVCSASQFILKQQFFRETPVI